MPATHSWGDDRLRTSPEALCRPDGVPSAASHAGVREHLWAGSCCRQGRPFSLLSRIPLHGCSQSGSSSCRGRRPHGEAPVDRATTGTRVRTLSPFPGSSDSAHFHLSCTLCQ